MQELTAAKLSAQNLNKIRLVEIAAWPGVWFLRPHPYRRSSWLLGRESHSSLGDVVTGWLSIFSVHGPPPESTYQANLVRGGRGGGGKRRGERGK